MHCTADSFTTPKTTKLRHSSGSAWTRLYDFNQTRPTEMKRRMALLGEMLAELGEECYIEPPFHANWGGRHVHFGNHVYANFNLTVVDDTHIYVGDHTMIGPKDREVYFRDRKIPPELAED